MVYVPSHALNLHPMRPHAQFHPEKSGSTGLAILEGFLDPAAAQVKGRLGGRRCETEVVMRLGSLKVGHIGSWTISLAAWSSGIIQTEFLGCYQESYAFGKFVGSWLNW